MMGDNFSDGMDSWFDAAMMGDNFSDGTDSWFDAAMMGNNFSDGTDSWLSIAEHIQDMGTILGTVHLKDLLGSGPLRGWLNALQGSFVGTWPGSRLWVSLKLVWCSLLIMAVTGMVLSQEKDDSDLWDLRARCSSHTNLTTTCMTKNSW
jgi:hypothetical protein